MKKTNKIQKPDKNCETPKDLQEKYQKTFDYEPSDEVVSKMSEYLDEV